MKFTDKINGISKRTITDEGYLLIKDARIARTGIQQYLSAELRNVDGSPMFPEKEPSTIVNVNRSPAEVFSKESLASFEMQPVTDGHPAEGVTVLNHEGLSVGVAFNIRNDNTFVIADLRITNADMIKTIDGGKRELSNGYDADLVVQSGKTVDGEVFEVEQKTIRGNHVAIVDQARCGPVCSISDNNHEEGDTMPKVIIAGVPYEVKDESLAAAVQNMLTKNAELASAASSSQATHDAAVSALTDTHVADKQTMQAQLDQAKSNEMTPEKLDAIIEDRMSIIEAAKKVVPNYDAKGKTCLAIKREVLTSKFGDSIATDKMKNDVYVDARFDALAEQAGTTTVKTPTEKLIGDAANNGGKKTLSSSEAALQRKRIGDSMVCSFPAGARNPGHPSHADFKAAVTAKVSEINQ